MSDLTEQQASQAVKITGATTSGAENNYVTADINGNMFINLRNSSGNETGISGTPLRVDPTGTTTQPISATSLPLPTGASTAANQATEIASLASIDAGIPAALGQTTMSASMPVTIASDQSVLNVKIPNDVITTGTMAALNATVVVDGAQQPYTTFLIELSGTWSSGTQIDFEGSTDNTNWLAVYAVQTNTATSTPNNGSNGGFGRLMFRGLASGLRYIRTRVNLYTASDSVAAKIVLTVAEGPVFLDAALPSGDNITGRTKITDGTDVGNVTTTGDQNVADTITTSLINGNLVVGTTAVAARVGGSNLANRKVLQITPINGPLYYGASGVTTTTGTPIQTNQTITFAINAAVDVFIVSASTSQNARIIEAS